MNAFSLSRPGTCRPCSGKGTLPAERGRLREAGWHGGGGVCESPVVRIVFGAETVQWLEHRRLSREQVAVLLTETALRLSDDVLEVVLDNGSESKRNRSKERSKR